jgi:hypothetical protein
MRWDYGSPLQSERLQNAALFLLGSTPFIYLTQIYTLAFHAVLSLTTWPSPGVAPKTLAFITHLKIAWLSGVLYPISPVLIAVVVLGFFSLQGRGARVGSGVILFVLSAVLALNIEHADPGGVFRWFDSIPPRRMTLF